MRKQEATLDYQDMYDYSGSTEIERTRSRAGKVLRRDYIVFDTTAAAMDFFIRKCGAPAGLHA
jgi:hypothetical protein